MEYKNIKSYTADEIFLKQGLNPFVMVATSAVGKTYIAVDILYNSLKLKYNHVSVVT